MSHLIGVQGVPAVPADIEGWQSSGTSVHDFRGLSDEAKAAVLARMDAVYKAVGLPKRFT